MSPKPKWVVISYVAVFAGSAIALIVRPHVDVPKIEIDEGFTVFAVLYIVAQGIERFMQPMTELTQGAKDKAEAKEKIRKGVNADANKEKVLQIEANRAVCFWAVATILALAACTILGLGLIQSIAAIGGGTVPSLFKAVDLLLTSLAIGAGTKPLHDLIGVIQNSKQKTDPSTTGA
jgi:hypothetical protein